MKYAIIVSKKDPAGMNIARQLIWKHGFQEVEDHYETGNISLYYEEDESIYCDSVDHRTDADIIIFATKHQSASGTPSLSVHVPGNWGKAELGGRDKKLCTAPASLVKEMFFELNKQGEGTGWEITLECVHHGPFLEKPVLFIEIGSSEEEWNDPKAGDIIANTIMKTLNRKTKKYKTVFAVGAGHYPLPFNKVLLRTDYAIGQICPKYQLENLDEEMVHQALRKNIENVEFVLLDWKGLGVYKEKIVLLLERKNIPYKRVREIMKELKN